MMGDKIPDSRSNPKPECKTNSVKGAENIPPTSMGQDGKPSKASSGIAFQEQHPNCPLVGGRYKTEAVKDFSDKLPGDMSDLGLK